VSPLQRFRSLKKFPSRYCSSPAPRFQKPLLKRSLTCPFIIASKIWETSYLGIPIYLCLLFGYKFFKKSKGVTPHTADFYTGKDIIDREEEEFLARKAEKQAARGNKRGGGWFYKTFIGWLF
jgi:amino acid permease